MPDFIESLQRVEENRAGRLPLIESVRDVLHDPEDLVDCRVPAPKANLLVLKDVLLHLTTAKVSSARHLRLSFPSQAEG